MNKSHHHSILRWTFAILTAVIVVAITLIYLNWQWLNDFARGLSYTPSADMTVVQSSLSLTERGTFLFQASQPELNNDQDFITNCHSDEMETAILGCYRNQVIFVHDIDDSELSGIIEVTTAHELLHAVFARLSTAERQTLEPILNQVLQDNQSILATELESYPADERLEEIYVRAGTEIRHLPSDLETHYRTIFQNRAQIVTFYENYISVFNNLKAKMAALEAELATLMATIEEQISTYEFALEQFQADVVSFNSCAAVEGCFSTLAEFNTRRDTLIATEQTLNTDYDSINSLIDTYNEKVAIYNQDVLRGQDLNELINSSSKPKNIE